MKLIELLVQEKFEWPCNVIMVHQDYDGQLWGLDTHGIAKYLKTLTHISDNARKFAVKESVVNMVTREQYEAALAAAQQQWDGEGFPPAGCDVEYDSYPDGWVTICIVAIVEDATFIVWKGGRHKGPDIIRGKFPIERIRPIRTEADKKRDAAVAEMCRKFGIQPETAAGCYDISLLLKDK